MTSQLLMLKKIMLTILHYTSFFNAKFKFFPQDHLQNIFLVLQGVFVISDNAFGCDEPTYNTSPVWKLSLLTQFSGFTTLHLLYFIFMYLFTYLFLFSFLSFACFYILAVDFVFICYSPILLLLCVFKFVCFFDT